MIFDRRGFVNLQTSSLCASGFEALFALNHVKTKEISPTLNERMTYKVFGRHLINQRFHPKFHLIFIKLNPNACLIWCGFYALSLDKKGKRSSATF